MEMCFSHLYSKLICILILSTISLTSDLFREDTFTWVGTASVESSVLVTKEISFTRITTVWCINECKKVPGCRGIEFCNSGNSLCRLWNGPFDQQTAANGTHLAECNRFSKATLLTSGVMTESVSVPIMSTDGITSMDTMTVVNVTTKGTTSLLKDTTKQQLTTSNEDTTTSCESTTTKDNTIQIDLTTAATTSSVDSTKVDTISVDSPTDDVTSLVDSTTTDAITTTNSTTYDATTKIDLTTLSHTTSFNSTTIDSSIVVTTRSVDSTTDDATTNIHLTSLETSTSKDSTTIDTTTSIDSSTVDATTSIALTTIDTTTSIVLTTNDATTSIDLTKVDATTLVDPTTVDATTSIDLTTGDATTSIDLTTVDATTSVDSTTVDATTSIDVTTVDTTSSVESTNVDATTSVESTTADATTLVDSTTVDATTSLDLTTVDATISKELTTVDATSYVESTTVDATTDLTTADTTAAIETTSESYCPDCECWMTQGLSGALPIYLNGQFKEVSCGNSSTYSWTVFQRRFDGSERFDRTWVEYEEGFGSAAGEFWLGNKYIHSLTVLGYTYLRIEVMTFGNAVRFIEYPDFQIGDSTENYVLRSIGTPTAKSAIMDDSLADSVSRAFSTPDSDNDNNKAQKDGNCALTLKSGWWFNNCADVNLNGEYSHIKEASEKIYWFGAWGWDISLKETTMKIRKP